MKKSLLIIDTFDASISTFYNQSDVNYEVYAIEYSTHNQLLKNNIPHKISEKLLELEDRKLIDEYVIKATTDWYKIDSIKNSLIYDSVSLGYLLEQELFFYFYNFYNKAIICKKIIETQKPQQVVCYTEVNDFIKQICDTNNIDVIIKNKSSTKSLEFDQIHIKYNFFKIPISLKISRKNFFKLKNIFEKFVFSIFNLNANPTKTGSILLTEFNPVQYDLLINELSKLDTNVILLNQRRSAVWNYQSFKIMKNSKCKIIDLNTFQNKINHIISSESKNFENTLNKLWKLDKDFETFFSIDENNIWNSIKISFSNTCTQRFLEAIRQILLLNKFFQSFNVNVILEWAELGQEEKNLLLVSKKFNVKSVMLQHALDTTYPGWTRFHRFVLGGYSHEYDSTKQALWGELPKKQALKFSTNTEKNILVTGSPRHDKFFLQQKNDKKGIILLATTAYREISSVETSFESFEIYDDFLREICRIVKKFPEKQLIVKTHPGSELENPIVPLLKQIDPNIKIFYNANLTELINSSELVVTFNNSTIAAESLILEKPTISLQTVNWPKSEDIVKMGAIVSISDIKDIESNIEKILFDKNFKNTLLENSRLFVKEYFSNGGTSSEELALKLNEF